MTKIGIWIVLGMMAIVFSGCTTTEVRRTDETTVYKPNVQPTESTPTPIHSGPSVSPTISSSSSTSTSSEPAWINERRQAQGQGVIDMARFPNQAQAKAMAKRAALMDARRNLLEMILGLRIDSRTVVRDMVAESDTIDASTSGIIRNSYEVGTNYGSDGICIVTAEVKLYDVWTYVKKESTYTK